MKPITFLFCLLTAQLLPAQSLSFQLADYPELNKQRIGIRGNTPPLSWDQSLFLDKDAQINLNFAEGTEVVEYKFVLEDKKGEVVWELRSDGNRMLFLGENMPESIEHQWDKANPIDISRLSLLSPEQLKQDLALLKQAILEINPASFRYRKQSEWDQAFREAEIYCQQPRSYAESFLLFSRLVGMVRCGHTLVNQLNQHPITKAVVMEQADKLPFAFTWIDNRMIVTQSAMEGSTIKTGTEILSINGTPVAEILSQLLPYAAADGANDAKRTSKMEGRALSYQYDAFDAYFPLLYPPQQGHYEVSLRNEDEEESQIMMLTAMSREERNQILDQRFAQRPKSFEESWDFSLMTDEIAYLKLGTMVVWRFQMDWKDFLKDAFKQMESLEIKQLIIDIRGNEGGADLVGMELARYLLQEDCIVQDLQPKSKIQRVPQGIKPYISTWDTSIYDISASLKALGDGWYTYKNDQPTYRVPAGSKTFDGKVYWLGDASNSSATYYLRRMAGQCQVGTIVGTPSGGNQNGINGGTLLLLSLPNSHFEVDIPVIGDFSRTPQPDAGLPVDVLLEPNVDAIRRGRDGQLDALMDLIEG